MKVPVYVLIAYNFAITDDSGGYLVDVKPFRYALEIRPFGSYYPFLLHHSSLPESIIAKYDDFFKKLC